MAKQKLVKRNAGAGRGFLNPQRSDESDEEYITPSQHYEMRKRQMEEEEREKTDRAYNKAVKTYAKGGIVRGMGAATRGGRFVRSC
jgi:hypothetical protein